MNAKHAIVTELQATRDSIDKRITALNNEMEDEWQNDRDTAVYKIRLERRLQQESEHLTAAIRTILQYIDPSPQRYLSQGEPT